MRSNKKKILVTGGAGFIGSHLVDLLMAEGQDVVVLDDLSNGKKSNLEHHRGSRKFTLLVGDITKPKDITKALKGVDVVFHLACLGVRHSIKYPFENHRVNAEGTLLVLQKALEAKVKKFIYCSSSEVYGTAQSVPMDEAHPTFPCTVYGASKLAGEAYARAYYRTYKFNTVVVRPFNAYGPRSHYEGDAGEVIPKSIVRALNGKSPLVFGGGRQTRDFTYVEDVAKAIAMTADQKNIGGMTFNIGSGFEISIERLIKKIIKISSANVDIKYEPDRPGDVLRLFSNPSRFRKVTGWKPSVSFDKGLKKTVEYFISRPEGVSRMLKQEGGRNWR